MSRIRYYVAASLDGFIATEDHDLSWLLQFGMTEFEESYTAFIADVGAMIMGATTYEWIRHEQPDEWPYREHPVFVVSHRQFDAPEGADVRFVSGDIGEIADAAIDSATGRDVWAIGGGSIAGQLLESARLDELHVTLMPVLLGSGIPLVSTAEAFSSLELTHQTVFPSGAVELVYEVASTAPRL